MNLVSEGGRLLADGWLLFGPLAPWTLPYGKPKPFEQKLTERAKVPKIRPRLVSLQSLPNSILRDLWVLLFKFPLRVSA